MKNHLVSAKHKINLSNWDPENTDGFKGNKSKGEEALAKACKELADLQELFYAEHKHKILIVFQGMDTAGKDGTIKTLFREVAPQGVRIANFKVPNDEESDHDYLWRVHKQTPAKGEIVLFNRSHYEEVLTVRVHDVVPKKIWERRFDQINCFERMLAEEGATILKFFLHISKDEQKRRLEERLHNPKKGWKFNPGDLTERKLWKEYTKAYEDVLSKTSTGWAPWYIIPSNKNWYRNLAVITIINDALRKLKIAYPKITFDPKKIVIR